MWGLSRLESSRSIFASGQYLALYLLLSICIYIAGAVDVAGDDALQGDLYRLEDGVLVIDWSREAGFNLNFTEEEDNLSRAVTGNDSHNASLGILQAENVSSDPDNAPAFLSFIEDDAYSGGTDGGAHLGRASWDPQAGAKGRHAEYGRRVTDLVGVFSIEMQIKLGSNLTNCPGTTEWIPCP